VNNVGGNLNITDPLCDIEDWRRVFRLNLEVPMEINNTFIPIMRKNKWGRICHVSSISALENHGPPAYCAAKAAVEMLTQTAALELAKYKIRVLCIAPATIQTEFHVNAGMSTAQAEQYYASSVQTHPIGRVGVPSDISELVLFLADSSKSGFMTGTTIHVDGGRMLTSSSAFKNT
jgi:3-oxoacyl-[acyl-carrier protein] reductase